VKGETVNARGRVPKSQSLDAAQWNEYAQDRRFVLEWCSFFDSLPQPETMIVGERAADGTLISREVPTPQVKLAKAFGKGARTVDDRMAAAGLPTLTAMRERVWQTVSKVLKRGKCRTDAEYYLVIERINDVGDLTLSTEERERLEQILRQYETRRSR